MKNKIFILIFSLISFVISNPIGGGLAFLNVPGTSKMNALGNTMFSDLANPSAMLINPANTWSQSSYNFSINNVLYNPDLDIQLNHLFLSFKIKESLFSFGFINHGIEKIENYTDDADFEGYLTFSDLALLLGYSHRTSNIFWGFSGALIIEEFSNIEYETNYFYQYDVGMSIIQIPITNSIQLSSGISLKNVVDSEFKIQNSANSNNILGSMLTYSSNNSPIKMNTYFDFLFQKTLNVYTGRFGFQLSYDFTIKSEPNKLGKVKYRPYGISLCLGYNDFRFTSLDTFDLQETNSYNSQLKYGLGITIPFIGNTVNLFLGQSIESSSNPLQSQFMSISISRKKKY